MQIIDVLSFFLIYFFFATAIFLMLAETVKEVFLAPIKALFLIPLIILYFFYVNIVKINRK